MEKRWEVLLTIIFWMGLFGLDRGTAAEDGSSGMIPLKIAWINKPPYTIPPTPDSHEVRGIIRKVMDDCDAIEPSFTNYSNGNASEYEMIKLLRENKVQIALPIFKHPSSRQYSEFEFVRIGPYPGSEYITTEDEINAFSAVVDEVLKSWPWLAVTLVLAAVAGIIMWALDTYWNIEQFPRPFIKGSWDGFWWSFISLTTVGYGDKTPKSIVARIFSVIWILFGVIIMAIIMADLTSTLTAVTVKKEKINFAIAGKKVAVLNNGTEHQHALAEKASPKVIDNVTAIIQAIRSRKVDGMLLDHYVASYYRIMEPKEFKSLFTIKTFEFEREFGILLSEDTMDIIKDCFSRYENIDHELQFIDTLEFMQRKPTTPSISLFDVSAPFVKWLLYRLLGVLGGLLVMGLVWDIFTKRRKVDNETTVELVSVHVEKLDDETAIERGAKRSDPEVTRQLLREVKERFDKLEAIFFEEYESLEPKELDDHH